MVATFSFIYYLIIVLIVFLLHIPVEELLNSFCDSVIDKQMPLFLGMVDGIGSQVQLQQRRQLYAEPMSKLRMLMIYCRTKPEEVLIVKDENGNIVRETMKDNDVLVQYKVTNLYC